PDRLRLPAADADGGLRCGLFRGIVRQGIHLGSQDDIHNIVVGAVRCAAGGTSLAGMARQDRTWIHAGRFLLAAACLCRQPLRTGSRPAPEFHMKFLLWAILIFAVVW